MKTKREVTVFATCLRDGLQAEKKKPVNVEARVSYAKEIRRMVAGKPRFRDGQPKLVIEAGFAVASYDDFATIQRVAREVPGVVVCSLARTCRADIERATEALHDAKERRIHVFVATSDVHLKKKLRKTQNQILSMIEENIRFARTLFDDVQFSPEDASRTGIRFLLKAIRTAVLAGATIINIPDTVGYSVGMEFGELIKNIVEFVHELNPFVVVSVHCHNDMGLAVANSLAGVENGAGQVEGCFGDIGERAGNAFLGAVLAALAVRVDHYACRVGLNLRKLGPVVRSLYEMLGRPVPERLPFCGDMVFAHPSGIHRHGVERDKRTYEIGKPKDFGWVGEQTHLTSSSGTAGLDHRLRRLGHKFGGDLLGLAFKEFKVLASTKPAIDDWDLQLIAQRAMLAGRVKKMELLTLADDGVEYSRLGGQVTVKIALKRDGLVFVGVGNGNGPVSAVKTAVIQVLSRSKIVERMRLEEFDVGKSHGGFEADGVATLRVVSGGKAGYGRETDSDIIKAVALSIVTAINHLLEVPVRVG